MPLPTHPLNLPRFAQQLAGYWLAIFTYVPMLTLLTLVSRGAWAPALLQGWGRLMMANIGVRVHVEPEVLQALSVRRARVVTFNHASTMDMFLMTYIWPPGGVAVVKRELLWIPVMGWMMMLLDFIPLNRGNKEKAAKMMAKSARRMRERELSVMIAPEGTRSPDGELQRFKLGAFNMAAQAQVPILPIVLHGVGQLWPKWWQYSEPGVVTIRMLPELAPPPDPEDAAAIRVMADQLRGRYARELETMTATVPWT